MTWWETLILACVQALVAASLAGWLVAWLTQKWIERRERRNRRYDLCLEVYGDIIEWIDEMETAVADWDGSARTLPLDLQRKRLRLYARLRLLSSTVVQAAFDNYKLLMRHRYEDSRDMQQGYVERNGWQEGDLHAKSLEARDRLIDAMTADIKE